MWWKLIKNNWYWNHITDWSEQFSLHVTSYLFSIFIFHLLCVFVIHFCCVKSPEDKANKFLLIPRSSWKSLSNFRYCWATIKWIIHDNIFRKFTRTERTPLSGLRNHIQENNLVIQNQFTGEKKMRQERRNKFRDIRSTADKFLLEIFIYIMFDQKTIQTNF